MATSKIAELQQQNKELCQLMVQLSSIILRNVVEQRQLLSVHTSKEASRLLVATTPTASIPRLREVSLCCAHLSRECSNEHVVHELEALSVLLADEAEKLESAFKTGKG